MERNLSLDYLKLIMAVMVVALHCGFLGDITELGRYLTKNGLFRMAVPTFLVINGYYFYRIYEQKSCVKWFARVGSLYAFWMLVYVYYWLDVSGGLRATTINAVFNLFIGYHHLWYVSGMIFAGVVVLLLLRVSVKILIVALFVTFVAGVLIQYLGNYHYFRGSILDLIFNYNWVHRSGLLLSFPFFATGFLINKYSISHKISLKLVISLTVLGLILLLGESYINYLQPNSTGSLENMATLIIVCPLVFLMFHKLYLRGSSKRLALISSGIYFVHTLVMHILESTTDLNATSLMVVVLSCSIIIALGLIQVNKKLKFIL